MVSEEKTLRDFLPSRLRQNYDAIRNTDTIVNKNLNVSDIEKIQQLINDAQPQNEIEETMRTTVQYLYRRDPNNFYQFLVKNHLFHLVLWTEAKRMSRHFRLNKFIHIHWNGNSYDCSQHTNFGKEKVVHFQQDRYEDDQKFEVEVEIEDNLDVKESVRNRLQKSSTIKDFMRRNSKVDGKILRSSNNGLDNGLDTTINIAGSRSII